MKSTLRNQRIRYHEVEVDENNVISGRFRSAELRDQAVAAVRRDFSDHTFRSVDGSDEYRFYAELSDTAISEIENYATSRTPGSLRNRVNELGVAEPIVQRQGRGRTIVQLPGVQDTAGAKRIIGRTANLGSRLEAPPAALASMKEEFPFRGEAAGRGA